MRRQTASARTLQRKQMRRAALTARPRRRGSRPRHGFRIRGAKSPAEQAWRRAFGGIIDIWQVRAVNQMQMLRNTRKKPIVSATSGAAKRRRRGRPSVTFENVAYGTAPQCGVCARSATVRRGSLRCPRHPTAALVR